MVRQVSCQVAAHSGARGGQQADCLSALIWLPENVSTVGRGKSSYQYQGATPYVVAQGPHSYWVV